MSDSSPASAPPALPGNGPGHPAPRADRGPSPVARPLPVAHGSRVVRRPPVVAVALAVPLFPPGTEPPRPRGTHTAEGDTR
ncbi:hypothetical protein AMK22_16755 [Streptomyces sp. CB01580]|nr:hypothetical protein AMK22_16755 [Streptomyces sp. CB01580]